MGSLHDHTRDHTNLVNSILLAIDRPGLLCWKNNTGVLYAKNGRPVSYGLVGSADVLVCVQGRFVALEAKTGGGTQSEQQERFEAAVKAAGGIYAVVRTPEDALAVVAGVMG